jgi:hypothetical protein
MFKHLRHSPRFAAMAIVVLATLVSATAALAHYGDGRGVERFNTQLRPVPHDPAADRGSDVTGTAKLLRRANNDVMVQIKAEGLDALPHAMHIHGKEAAGEIAMCPGADRRDDLVDDGLIETVEGLPDYGGILTSFTLFGDTSPASALALDRFPTADQNGRLRYKRTIAVPADVASRLDELHIVIHGADLDRNGSYGGRTTALGAPLEAELPVACGQIDAKKGKGSKRGNG